MIEVMKLDMEGAAAAFGAAKAIASTKPLSMEVNFIVAASENMISGGGMRLVTYSQLSMGKQLRLIIPMLKVDLHLQMLLSMLVSSKLTRLLIWQL